MSVTGLGDVRTRERGFTLVELLVSLSVLGLVAAMLAAALGTLGLVTARERRTGDRLDEVVAAQALLRARLERLRPEPLLTQTGALAEVQGGLARLDFVAPPPDRDRPDAPRRYRIVLDRGNLLLLGANVLGRGVGADAPAGAGWTAQPVLHGVAGLRFAYFGPDATGARRWRTLWTPQPQPPELVAVRVTFAPGDRRRWPDLLVRPRAAASPTCVPDAGAGRCGI